MKEKELLELLKEYEHYKFMTAHPLQAVFSRQHGMSFSDFILWLKSRQRI